MEIINMIAVTIKQLTISNFRSPCTREYITLQHFITLNKECPINSLISEARPPLIYVSSILKRHLKHFTTSQVLQFGVRLKHFYALAHQEPTFKAETSLHCICHEKVTSDFQMHL